MNFLVPLMDRDSLALVDVVHAGGAVCGWQVETAGDAAESVASMALNAGMPVPGPHRVLSRSIAAAEALAGETAATVRIGGVEIPAQRFGAVAPTRESTGAIEAMPFFAGQSAGAVYAIRPAGEIVEDLASGIR